jgi:hypothetical protein
VGGNGEHERQVHLSAFGTRTEENGTDAFFDDSICGHVDLHYAPNIE